LYATMEEAATDADVLNRLWELSRLEHPPTAREEREFALLKYQLERSLERSMVLEERTKRLVRYLKAA
jgi:hypothetical protein